ncbi:hypothetical protein FRC09_004569 [Ceratobasidium sp. 395]|nr:hypothetical protein FRC09_004569 [Ceratobasidium sp. 395]
MGQAISKIEQSVRKRFKKIFNNPPNGPQPSTAPAPQGPNIPNINAIHPQPVPDQMIPLHPLPTTPSSRPEPSSATRPPAPISSVPPTTEQDAAHDSWPGLKAFARIIHGGSELLAPLKPAVSGISAVIDTFELAAQNREDYQRLRTELNALLHDLAGHLGSSTPLTMTSTAVNLAQGIERELKIIRSKQDQSDTDADQILEHYRGVQGLLQRLTLNANLETWKIVSEQATETRLNKLPNSLAAKYRSAKSSVLREECTPNTRVKVLEELYEWAHDSESQKIYWLNGMAGTGKTTIAYSLCKELEHSRSLAASFFCSRQLQECREVDRIVPTISYQLSRFSLPFRAAVSRVLETDPEVYNQLLLDQLRQLVLEPLSKVKDALPTSLVVVVDALDECDDNRGVEVLKSLLLYARDLPVKFFVTSRPDARILDLMRGQKGEHSSRELHLHNLDRLIVREDIKTYLLGKIASHIRLSTVNLDILVERSGTLFIYAATVARYIENDNFSRATERLEEILDSVASGSAGDSDREVNGLYGAILAAAFENPSLTKTDRANMKQILNTVVCAQEPLAIETMAGLLELKKETVHAALRPLLSVIQVSDAAQIIAALHESFPDYLLDKTRSGSFCCDREEHNVRLTRICFNQINIADPSFNICGLESSYVFDKDVSSLPTRVEKAISQKLRYACHYWGVHIMLAGDSRAFASTLLNFLSNRFLLWLEVVNLCEYIHDGVRTLHRMQKWAANTGWLDNNTKQLLRDAWMFALSFSSSPARLSTPHIYISALTFWPDHSPMTVCYKQYRLKLITSACTAMNLRSTIPLSVQDTQSLVMSVSYSPDGAYIVSGSNDHAIRIRDALTGQPVGQPLEGHTRAVKSVAYSPDGAYIVSGSLDKTIRIWDAYARQPVGQPLEGHINSVTSVAYSPDGAYITSGSYDRTIRIWDAHTGQPVGQPLEGHTSYVHSVAYSPDGAYIVSGSDDRTIRIWDAYTRQSVGQPLEGHTSSVKSVAYSPDGAYIVSGSDDSIIRIWDAHTGQPVGQPLEGHTSWVNSVAYSPGGAYIVSGSEDRTIRIWDAYTCQLVGQPLEGHTDFVKSVAYSPNGTYIVSGSLDYTIRIWDTHTHQSVGQSIMEGHTRSVKSAAYSPDGAYIVSGSDDRTIRIWDAYTRQPVGQPLEGHTRDVTSVAYSPDGAYITSGSLDKTIRIWDAPTGQPVGQLLEGHTRSVESVAYSPDGAYIVSGSGDKTIRIWDARTRLPVGQPLEGHTRAVKSVAYSPDGAYIVSGSLDKTIRIWDAHARQPVGQPLEGHISSVTPVAYSPDGAYITSSSRDGTIRIWGAQSVIPTGFTQESQNGESHLAHPLHVAPEVKSTERFVLCNLGCYIDCPHMAWTSNEDGWVVFNKDKLIWVPPDLRATLLTPRGAAVLCRRGFLQLDLDRNKLGDHWCENFQPRSVRP